MLQRRVARMGDDITYIYGGREEVGSPLRDGVAPHSLYFTLNSHVSRAATARCARRFTVLLNLLHLRSAV